jgi:hypothetical protein
VAKVSTYTWAPALGLWGESLVAEEVSPLPGSHLTCAWLTVTLDWEGFGSDPVLQAFGGALTIEGVQSVGVIATLKHLIANEQEQYRMYSLVKPGISSNVDDRTLHELYLWPFAEGVRSGVGSVMISYNAVSSC